MVIGGSKPTGLNSGHDKFVDKIAFRFIKWALVIKFFGRYRKNYFTRTIVFTKWFDRCQRNIVTKGCAWFVFILSTRPYLRLKRFTASRLTLDFYNLGLVSYLGIPARKVYLYTTTLFFETVLLPDIFHPIGRKSSTVFRRRNTFLKYRSQTMTTTMFEIFDFSFLFEFFPVFHRNSIVKSNV